MSSKMRKTKSQTTKSKSSSVVPKGDKSSKRSAKSSSQKKQNFFSLFGTKSTTFDSRDSRGDDDSSDSNSSASDDEEDYSYSGSSHTYTEDEDDETLASYESNETSRSQLKFDQQLRSQHAAACNLMKNGKFGKALTEFEAILASILKRYGEVHQRVGAALHNVGIANLRAGKLEDAMDATEEAVRIRKLTLGNDDPKVADSLVELGIILLSMKEYPDALDIFNEALKIRRKEAEDSVNDDDTKESQMRIAKVQNNIGCVNFERGNFGDATSAFEEAVRLQKSALGNNVSSYNASKPGVLTMATTMCNMGYVYLRKAEFTKAAKTFDESLTIQKKLLGADNKLVLNTLDNLGFAHTMNQSYSTALNVYETLYSNQQKSYEQTPIDCAETLRNLIYCMLKLSRYEEALEKIVTLEEIQLQNQGDGSKAVAETQQLMGQVNYKVMKYPSLGESTAIAFNRLNIFQSNCGPCKEGEDGDEVDLTDWTPKMPANCSKMSGHRVTYA